MLDLKDFSFLENQTMFDFKGFFLKVVSYWKWILFCVVLFLFIAYQINIRKEKIYSVESVIAVREESSPLLTSNTSLIFNWGGVSEKVQTISTILKSRNHNEQVVSQLDYYIDYLKENKYVYVDAYGDVPFVVKIDKSKPQLLNHLVKITFIDQTQYKITVEFESNKVNTVVYNEDFVSNSNVETGQFSKNYKVGEKVSLPYLHLNLHLNIDAINYVGKEYFIRFQDFNSVVYKYRNISVSPINKVTGSILQLELQGTNKARIVDYLNATTEVLQKNELDGKNLFAVNTIKFIDSTLAKMQTENAKTSAAMRDFAKDKNIYELSESGEGLLTSRATQYDLEKDAVLRKIQYYKSLEKYLQNNSDFSDLPAPTVAGIEDVNIVSNVSQLINLSVQKSKTAFAIKSETHSKQMDSKMESLKLVLLENITSARSALNYDLGLINSKMGGVERSIRKMPVEKQEYIEIIRKHDLEQQLLSNFLTKRNEAEIMKASNLSDVHFIDRAKDVGGGLIGPKTNINYVIAIFMGILLPVLLILIFTVFDNSIHNYEEVKRLSKIPILGVLPKKQKLESNLAVIDNPKSNLSESFRAVRSSLQFLYKKQQITGSKTLMITSSVSGEGKTFCAINLASVFALNEKKTIVVGLDLRKPKIYGDFNIKNDVGVVNYLIGQKTLNEITQKTNIPYLDVIVAGPIPPNPSELIMGDNMEQMIKELQEEYDYIILDTPPVGMVSDAIEVAPYCDVVLYVVRQNVTKKSMLSIVNEKQRKGELTNLSLLLNGFESKAKYGYGYGYGGYSSGYRYYDEDFEKLSLIHKIKNIFKRKNSRK